MGYNIFRNDDRFERFCRAWHNSTAIQTMETFQIVFRAADTDRRNNPTSAELGFACAAHVPPQK